MVAPNRIDPGVLGHLLSQHHELHARMLALRAAFHAGARPPADVDAIHGMLHQLRDWLAAHFAAEEQGGYLEESIARLPRLSAAAREVMAEHPGLLAELDALLETTSMRDIHAAGWNAAVRGFATFTEHLLAHERNENGVVQQGFNEDFGFPD